MRIKCLLARINLACTILVGIFVSASRKFAMHVVIEDNGDYFRKCTFCVTSLGKAVVTEARRKDVASVP